MPLTRNVLRRCSRAIFGLLVAFVPISGHVLSDNALQILTGHESAVFSVAVSPNGQFIASAGADSTIRIWDVQSGQSLRVINDAARFYSVAFSPNGQLVVSGGGNSQVEIWSVSTGENVRRLVGHTDAVRSTSFSPDGRFIVSGGSDASIRIWDAETGAQLRTLSADSEVWDVAYSPDGESLVSAHLDRTVRIWEASIGAEIWAFRRHEGPVRSVAFSPDGQFIVSAGRDGSVHVWDSETGRIAHTLSGHTFWINSVAFSPDGRYIVSASADHTVIAWDAESGSQVRVWRGHTFTVNQATFSPNGERVVSASGDKTVRIWRTALGTALPKGPTLVTPQDGAMDVPTSPMLLWNRSDTSEHYHIQVSASPTFDTVEVDDQNVSGAGYLATSLQPRTRYYWRVRPAGPGNASFWSAIYSFTTEGTELAAPTSLSPASGSVLQSERAVLSWTGLAAAYEIEVSTNPTFIQTFAHDKAVEATAYTVDGLNIGTTYYWRVRARSGIEVGPWSEVGSFSALGSISVEGVVEQVENGLIRVRLQGYQAVAPRAKGLVTRSIQIEEESRQIRVAFIRVETISSDTGDTVLHCVVEDRTAEVQAGDRVLFGAIAP